MRKLLARIVWLAVALLGALGYVTLALYRDEPLNSVYILMAALCTYAIGYRFYAKWIATRVLVLDERRATPCETHDDGKDYVRTNKWIVFGHHFAAISGPGPLVGPVLAAQFGYLPGTLWILIGVLLGGAVQDFVVLFCSVRRDGRSLGQMLKEEMNSLAGAVALCAILAIMVILLAVLSLVVVKALAESPWGVFTVGATIPIAMFMGLFLRFGRIGKVLEASAIGVVLLLLAVWGGKFFHQDPALGSILTLSPIRLGWWMIIYGLAASALPVWLLLAPRDYLSTFMKLGTILALAFGIFCLHPVLQLPAISHFIDGSGPVVPGKVFPFCFITIACGSISGFHTMIASGTTPKIITRESHIRSVGYGAMCLESLVAIMALIAACALEPGVYFSMNIKGEALATVAKVNAMGFPITEPHMHQLAQTVGEGTLFGRTGGAATLAVGMAQIFSKLVQGRWLDLWYHFAIMFEALFILTTIDAGTRVSRYLLQDLLGHLWKPLADTRQYGSTIIASVLIVGAWGYFLIQGINDPLGGINSLWPLFGIANQLLAVIALCLATTVLLKMQLTGVLPSQNAISPPREGTRPTTANAQNTSTGRPVLALVTLMPMLALLAVTMTAGTEKIFNHDPRIGFLATANSLELKLPALKAAVETAHSSASELATAEKALRENQVLRFNALLDAGVTATLLSMVVVIVVLSLREWTLLLARKKLARLCETPPTWLPDYALVQPKSLNILGFLGLALAMAKELSGESAAERSQAPTPVCACKVHSPEQRRQAWLQTAEKRFDGINRCC